jgi:hypothetical protein
VRNYLDPTTEAKITGVVERELIAEQVGCRPRHEPAPAESQVQGMSCRTSGIASSVSVACLCR